MDKLFVMKEFQFGWLAEGAHFFLAATGEGSVSMAEGEKLIVLERDQGDGWTHVRKLAGSGSAAEGFVPTSYIRLGD